MARQRILVVEDETVIAKNLEKLLKGMGYGVIGISSTGEDAVKIALDKHPDLILMDIRLEGKMDGVEAAVQIRKHVDIPVIYVTAFADKTTLQRAKETQPYGYLHKPFKKGDLQSAIEMALYKHEVEKQLRSSEERFRQITENIREVFWLTDWSENRILYISPAYEEIWGRPCEDLIRKPGSWSDNIDPADRDRVVEAFRKAPEGEYDEVYRIVRGDGSTRWIHDRAFPIHDAEGKVWRVAGISEDVTDLKQAEEEVRKSRDDLEDRVKERTREIKEKAESLKAVNELAIELASVSPDVDPYRLLGEKIKEITGALGAVVTSYDDSTRELAVKYLAIPKSELAKINKLLKKKAQGMRFPVSAEMFDRMITEVVAKFADLSELTFGQIPKTVAAAIQKMFGVGEVAGFVLHHGGQVMGTVGVFMPADASPLSGDIMRIIANLGAVALRREYAEEAVRESEEKFRELADLLPQTVFEIDLEGRFTYSNRYGFESTGYTQEDIDKGLNALQLFIPEDRERVRQNIGNILRGDKFEGHEYTALKKDGSTFPVIIYSSPITCEGKPVGLRGIVADITERKRALEALRESEERFRNIAENAMEWIWEVDTRGKYTYASPVVEQILGYKPEEILGKHFYDFFHPEDQEELKKAAFEAFAKKQSFKEFINRNVHKDGETVWLSTSGVPILDEKGELLGYRGADIDITERKRAEEALRESEEHYRILTEEALVGVYIFRHGRYIFVNPAMEKITGYSQEELLNISPLDLVVPEDHNLLNDRHESAVRGEEIPAEYVIRIRRKDGRCAVLQINTHPVNYEGARAFLGNCIDISERKRAESALKRRVKTSNVLAALTSDLYTAGSVQQVLDVTIKHLSEVFPFYVSVNLIEEKEGKRFLPVKAYHIESKILSFAEKLIGRKFMSWPIPLYQDSVISRTMSTGHPTVIGLDFEPDEPVVQTDVKTMLEAMLEGKSPLRPVAKLIAERTGEKSLLGIPFSNASGEIIGSLTVLADFRFSRDDYNLAKVASDMIGRALGQLLLTEELRESEERYRTLQDNVPVGIFRTTPEGNLLSANPAMLRMLGYASMQEFKPISVEEVYVVSEHRAEFRRVLEQKGSIADFEVQLKRKDGSFFWASLNASAIKDEAGNVIYYDGIMADITERKRGEVLRQVRVQLLDMLREVGTIEDCLQLACAAVRDARLFKRAVFTTKDEKGETTHFAQVGVEPQLVEELSKASPAAKETLEQMFHPEFKISHSYFIPVEAGVDIEQTGRYVLQEEESGKGPEAWQQGDELLVPMLGMGGSVESWLSVDTPFDRKRPDRTTVIYLEDIVDIVARQIREIENFQELLASEERYRSLVETMNDGFAIQDENGVITYVNDRFCEMLGFDRSELIDRPATDFLDADNRKIMNKQTALRDKLEGESFDLVWMKKNADAVHTIISPSILRGGEGRYTGSFAVITDITERIRSREALEASEARFRRFAGVVQDMIYRYDTRRNQYDFISPSCEQMTGYQSKDFMTAPTGFWQSLIHPEDVERVIGEKQRQTSRGTANTSFNLDYRIIRKDGKVRWVNEHGNFEVDEEENVTSFNGVVRDISVRKQAEEELRASEERYRALTEKAPIGVYIFRDDHFQYVNPAMEEIFGYSAIELTNVRAWNFVHPEDMENVIKTRAEAMVRGQAVPSPYELRIIRKDGSVATLSIKAQEIIYQDQPAHLGNCIDITERVRAEEKVEHLNAVLRAIRNVNQIITKETEPSRLLQEICDKLVETRGFYSTWVVLVDEHGTPISASYSGVEERFPSIHAQLRNSQLPECGRDALNSDDILIVEDPGSRCADCSSVEDCEGVGILTVKLTYADKQYGVLSVTLPGELANEQEELALFVEVAGDIAFALHSIELEKKHKRAEQILEREHRAFRIIAESAVLSSGVTDLCQRVISGLVDALEFDAGSFRKFDASSASLKLEAHFGLSEYELMQALPVQPLEDKRYIAALTARSGQPIIAPDVFTEPMLEPFLARLSDYAERSLISWPVKGAGGNLLGVLHLWSRKPVDIPADAKKLFERVAGMFAAALERKLAEDALMLEKDRIKQYLDIAGVMLVAFNSDGKATMINRKGCEILGYEESEILGRNWFEDFLPPETSADIQAFFTKLMNGEAEPDEFYENPVLTKRGEERLILWHNTIITDDKGNITGLLSSGEDITESKHAQREIRERLSYEEAIAYCSQLLVEVPDLTEAVGEITKELIFVAGVSRVYVYENFMDNKRGGCIRMIHEEAAKKCQARSQTLKPLAYSDLSPSLLEKLEAGRPYGGSVIELPQQDRRRLIAGDVLSILVIPIQVENQLWGFIGFDDCLTDRRWKHMDIQLLKTVSSMIGTTIERNLTGLALKESEERYRAFTEEALVGVYIYRDGGFLFANREMEVISGYSREELLSLSTSELVPAEDASIYQERDEARKRGEKVPAQYNMRIIRKDGQMAILELRTRPIVYEGEEASLGNCIDITDMRRVQEELEKSEERYRILTEEAMVGIYLVAEGRFRFVNPAMERITGYSRQELLELDDVYRIIHPDDIKQIEERSKHRQPGVPDQYQMKTIRKDGDLATLEVRVRPIPYGDKLAFLGNCVDISELIKQRAQIERAKLEWERTFDSISDLVMMVDEKNRIIRANRAAAEYTQKEFTDLLGKSYLTVFNIEGLDGEVDRSGKPKLPEHFEIEDPLKNRIFSVSASPILDPSGDTVATVHVARDITQMRQMEDALLESENQFRGLAESAQDVIFSIGLDGVIRYVNPAVEEVLGYRVADLLAERLENIIASNQPDRKEFEPLLDAFTLDKKRIPVFEAEIEDVKGRRHTIEISARRLPHQIIGIARDVTERKKMQQRLFSASKLASIGVLAAGIAHQVNNPLATMLATSSLLRSSLNKKDDVPDDVKQMASKHLDTMETQIERTSKVVSGLLEFARPKHARVQPADVNAIITQALELVSQHLSFERYKVNTDLDPGLPLAMVDPVAYQQVVVNVVQNAFEAMGEEGELYLETGLNRGEIITLSIRDTGPGIPPSVREEIFEPLFSTKTDEKGTGLGLAVSEMLLERFGGRIYLVDTQDRGATFVVEVPAKKEEDHET